METQSHEPNWLAFSLITIFVVFLLSLTVYLLVFRGLPGSNSNSSNSSTTKTASVSITVSGFNPEEISIPKGTTVTWTNTDTSAHQVASDPYPLDNSLKELGKGRVLSTNDTFSFTFDQTGTFTYHDELNPFKIKGIVKVK